MYKYFIAAGAVGLAALTYHSGSASQPQTEAQIMEKVLGPSLPKNFGDGIYFESVKAEGDVLVAHIDMPNNTGADSSEMERAVLVGLCSRDGGAKFFERGGKLRVDVSTGGGTPDQGSVVSDCS
jgi:hypothetical protein